MDFPRQRERNLHKVADAGLSGNAIKSTRAKRDLAKVTEEKEVRRIRVLGVSLNLLLQDPDGSINLSDVSRVLER
jgi:hypothetical protein